MFNPTSNTYSFKYIITGISGPGIKQVYLPPWPEESKILFKKEQKFIKPIPSEQLKEWMEEADIERNRKDTKGNYCNLSYVHPHQKEINEWEDSQWERGNEGLFFWNVGLKTYITKDHYRYLTEWHPDFEVEYRETDKEFFYWCQYWEEDPDSYGGTYNTLRREGKSAKMGFWLINRTISNFKHYAGCQGEDDVKIRAFYELHVLPPFYKLPSYRRPIYDTNSLQKKGIIFNEPPRRHQIKRKSGREVLESKLDYRTSEENKYDQAKLHSYVMEEAGKTLTANVSKRWGFVKPALSLGKKIIGKAMIGTTVEFMDTSGKGGTAYEKLCMESDYDKRNANGQTKSGLYAALMPADCALEGFFDDNGHPLRDQAREWILNAREDVEDNPADYATLVRKYPLDWDEVFYTSAEHCEFNIKILQDRKKELMRKPPPMRRFDLQWENNVRFSKIVMQDNPSGWFKTTKVFTGEEAERIYNQVSRRVENGEQRFAPLNDNLFASGLDPIDHGMVVSDSPMGEDGFTSSRKSKPVLLIKSKYDTAIDGMMDFELMKQRAKEKFPYKTGIHVAMMDERPGDPNVLFERVLMVLWLMGISVGVESQKPGVINWLRKAGCSDFIWHKYVPDEKKTRPGDMVEGTPASQPIIQEYTGLIATDVEYFGHTYPFIEVVNNDLRFRPDKTREFDYTVSQGNMEIAAQMRPRNQRPKPRQIEEYFRRFIRLPNGTMVPMK